MSAYHNYHFSMKKWKPSYSKSTGMRRFRADHEIKDFISGTEFTSYGIDKFGAVLAWSNSRMTQIGWVQ